MRRGLGFGLGMGYKNLIPYDKHVHSMSAKGISCVDKYIPPVKPNQYFDKRLINKGIKVELEHTKSKKIAKRIALAHLNESKNYYYELDKMEKRLNAKNSPSHFSFKGRYTLRGINGRWYVYDRELNTTIEDTGANTFTKAEKYLYKHYPSSLNAKGMDYSFKDEFRGLRQEAKELTTSDLQGRAMVVASKIAKQLNLKPDKITDTGKFYWELENLLLEYANGEIDINTAQRYILDLPKNSEETLNAKVDLNKYQGKWYDQASFPTWFDKNCEGQRAEYKVRPDGKVDVINTCLPSGRQVKGTARSVSKDNKNLKVSFFPLIEGDYNILYLDKGYKNVVVGSSSKNYLWILTKNKNIPKKELDKLVMIAKKKGYDTSKLKVMTLKASGSANIEAPREITQELKTPSVEVLPKVVFDKKFAKDYKSWEQGYATTKISPDGTTKVYVSDDGDKDYTKEGKLLMHELKEIEIFKDLVNNKHISPSIADEMAHNLNPVKIQGVSAYYPLDPTN